MTNQAGTGSSSFHNATDNTARVSDRLIDFFVTYGVQIIGALIILAVGILIARWLGGLAQKALLRREMEPPVRNLIVRVIKLLLVILTFVLALEKVGVPIAPLVAGIGVVGVGVGLATQGVLSNIVAGLTIIFTKPFRVGEYVEIHGVHGQVENIELFTTTLVHSDLSRVIVPNRKIVGEILHNYGSLRQQDLSIGVAYQTDLTRAFACIDEIMEANPAVLRDPKPVIAIQSFGESAIQIAIKPWTLVKDFGAARASLNKALIDRFRAENIVVPMPQREVHLLSDLSPSAHQRETRVA